jgi:peptidyl-Lys metalloendopeptidase
MKWAIAITFCAAIQGMAAYAGQVIGCDKDQARIVEDSIRQAKALTLRAASVVGDTPEYAKWFGAYSNSNAEQVRRNLKAVVGAIRSAAVVATCETTNDDGCSDGEYAWVYPNEPFRIQLCPAFFTLPPLELLAPGQRSSDNGTREGTIVHELSHFHRVGNTLDHCYSRSDCGAMASADPLRAIRNADSYQYFTEDVTYYARQPIPGKPPAAPRDN